LYYFESPHIGTCKVEARTSGKHGFGKPKHFIFTSLDPTRTGSYTLRHRGTAAERVHQSSAHRNFNLVMSAIGQFCASGTDLYETTECELDPLAEFFKGEMTNRYGRLLSATSFLPRRAAKAGADANDR
jgi:hypothetical protein